MLQVTLPRFYDPRGSLSAVQGLAWPIRRAYWLYDIPGGESMRGGHANRTCHRLVVALSGSFQVYAIAANGLSESILLNRPWIAVEIAALTWLELREFSSGAACLVLASEEYDAADYIRDRVEWESLTRRQV